MFDLVVQGRILEDGKLREANICVENGVISEIRRSIPSTGEMGNLISFGRKIILPGVIDSHVHMRDPGSTHKEDLYTGSVSAAFGGVTAFVDMPNTVPPTMDMSTFLEKSERASSHSVIDFGLNLCIMDGSEKGSMENIIDPGTKYGRPIALKAFMGGSTGSLVYGPYRDLRRWGDLLGRSNIPLCVHAEDGDSFKKEFSGAGSILTAHDEMRPPDAEASAVRKVLKNLGDREHMVHILHISSERGLRAAEGRGCSLEVTPHHLLLDIKTAESGLEDPALAKVNPPIRRTTDRASLWEAVNRSVIDTIGSDHAPHTLEEKTEEDPPPSGIPGTETMLPLMLQKVMEKKIELYRLIELLSANPAERFGLKDRGALASGMKADLIIIDPQSSRKIKAEDLHSKCGWTVYEGMEGIFPERVYSRGELIIEDQELCAKKGRGVPLKA